MIDPDNYRILQEAWLGEHGVRRGSRVKVLRSATRHERGWGTYWSSDMTEKVGRVLRVTGLDSHCGLLLADGNFYPCFVLEKATTDSEETSHSRIPF